MNKFREHLKRCAEIVASWPPWKQNLLENSMKATCPPREPIHDEKHLVWLVNGHRRAVVIDWSPEDAKLRCCMNDPQGGWENATCSLITKVRRTRTNLVLCMEM